MEDSKILWYIVLGAIYFLSKAFGKKKKKPQPQETYESEQNYTPDEIPEKPKSTSFEDILKELTTEVIPEEKAKKQTKPEIFEEEIKPLVSETAPLPSYEQKSTQPIQDKKPEVKERKKPEFKRTAHFEISEERNMVAEDIHELLADMDGPKKAVILSEILNRKY